MPIAITNIIIIVIIAVVHCQFAVIVIVIVIELVDSRSAILPCFGVMVQQLLV